MSSGAMIAAVAQAGSSSRPSIVIGDCVRTAPSRFMDAASVSDWASSAGAHTSSASAAGDAPARC